METILSVSRRKIGVSQVSLEQKLKVSDDKTINKVVGVSSKAYIENCEVLNGEANFNGQAIFYVHYLDEDNTLCAMTEKMPFSSKIEDNTLNATMQSIYKVELVDINILNANTLDVNVQATFEVCLDVVENAEVEPFNPIDENIITRKDNKTYMKMIDAGKATVLVQDEVDVKQNVSKVLSSNYNLCVKKVSPGTGYLTVEGSVNFRACVEISNGEEIKVKQIEEVFNFKEEVDAEKVMPEDLVNYCACIKYDETMVEVLGDEDSRTKLSVSVPMLLKYVAFRQEQCEFVVDAYSLTHKVNFVSDTFFVGNVLNNTLKTHIDGEVEISEDMPEINEVKFVSGENINLTNYFVEDDMLNLEGVLTCNVVYNGGDEVETLSSSQVEIPFAEKLDVKDLTLSNDVFVVASVDNLVVKSRRGKNIDVDCDVMVSFDSYDKKPESYLKEVVLTEELTQNPYSLEIYLAPQGSTLWSIAKHLNIKEDDIVKQNPSLVYPLEQTESVVYFKQK